MAKESIRDRKKRRKSPFRSVIQEDQRLRRAPTDNAILSYLERHGVRDDQLVQAPFGEAEPVAPNTNEANRSKNCRVVIRRMASSPS